MRPSWWSWWVRQLHTPVGELIRKVERRISLVLRRRRDKCRAHRLGSYLADVPSEMLSRLFPSISDYRFANDRQYSLRLASLYLEHRFDLLGSGWVELAYGISCKGLNGSCYKAEVFQSPDANGEWLTSRVNPANLTEAKRIWCLVDPDYRPIDWQLDFKSGYRWSESAWHEDIVFSKSASGADIKVPWELARCHHLPQLALAHGFKTEPAMRSRCAREFRNQVLDFMANNPPGFGVNWRCTMDVGIRISNWLVAYDMFVSNGATFDAGFDALFQRSTLEHGRHIVSNVEWTESGRSNHYLSNVVGLLLLAAYLPSNQETDAWAGWALRELVFEIRTQFDEDGANREGSTSYHRLSAEMAIYGCAYALRMLKDRPGIVMAGMNSVPGLCGWGGRPRSAIAGVASELSTGQLPEDVYLRLHGMARLVEELTRPDGTVTQIGDNDSGRFMKLSATYDFEGLGSLPYERFLDHTHVIELLSALLKIEGRECFSIESMMLRQVAGALPRPLLSKQKTSPAQSDWKKFSQFYDSVPAECRQRYVFRMPYAYTGQVIATGFREFGVFTWKTAGLYLLFRCGPSVRYGQGSHLHHDQLAVELVIDGVNRASDPGSFLYTPLPEFRNAYRGLKAHFTPWPLAEKLIPGDQGLFVFPDNYRAECLHFSNEAMVGRHWGFGQATYRLISFEGNNLVIRDFSESVALQRCPVSGEPFCFVGLPFSDGYGRREGSSR